MMGIALVDIDIEFKKKISNTKYLERRMLVVEVGADQVGGLKTLCIKITYSSREPRRVFLPCIKIGYSSAMY